MIFVRYFKIFFLIFTAYTLAEAQRVGLNSEAWKTISTPHFDVIVSAKQQDLGLYYAHAAEKAYQQLSSVFNEKTEKIILVINDTTDESNAYATRIPYPYIMVFAVPINDHEALSEASDWAKEVTIHELSHIMQFEPASGFYKILRPIFGTIIAPNMLMPSWWKEGMAVELETQFTTRGRLRSIYQDAQTRSFTIDEAWNNYPIAQANEVLPSWPYGHRPYLFGSLFFSQLTFETKDIKSINYLAETQGGRAPYFIEASMRDLKNQTYEDFYNKALNENYSIGLSQLSELRKILPTEVVHVQQNNETSFLPRLFKKHNLLAFVENVAGEEQISIQDMTGKKLEYKKLPSGDLSGFDIHPTEKKLAYSKLNKLNSKYFWSDIYLYDVETDQHTRITNAQRARSLSFSEDGKSIVFVSTFAGQTQIRTLNVDNKKVQFVINSTLGYRYESPIFWNEQIILAVKIDKNGNHSIVKIDLPTKVETTLNLNLLHPRFLRKINQNLYFVSSENGVNNLYRSHNLKTAEPVTHVLTGIWSYDVDSDEKQAWVSLMTSKGFKVSQLPLAPYQKLPKITNTIANRYQFQDTNYTYNKFKMSDYSAANYLWPRYWIPFVSASSSSKGLFLQAQTKGQDPIGIHSYSLAANYDSELNKGNFSGIYINNSFMLPFQLSTLAYNRALGSRNDIVQTTTHSFSLLPDLFSLNENLKLALGLQYQETAYTSRSTHGGLFSTVSYQDYSQNLHQISPEKGWGGLLQIEKNFKINDEINGVATDYEKASFSLIGFHSKWLPQHHAIKAKLSGTTIFKNVLGRFGDSSSSVFFDEDGLTPQFVVRGYLPAQFFGRNLWSTNLEYRFPITNIEKGNGTYAYFFKRLNGAFVIDGLGVEGSGLTEKNALKSLKLSDSIWSTGFELKLASTIGYILPMNFVLGYYLPHSSEFVSGGQIGFGLQISGF